MGHNRIHGDAVRRIGTSIASNSSLLSLSLSFNPIGCDSAGHIARGLSTNRCLQAISLCGCGIEARGASSLAESLSIRSALRQIDLSYNPIGLRGSIALASALGSLSHVGLSNCKISDRGGIEIARVLKDNPSLAYLDLGRNRIGWKGAEALADALQSPSCRVKHLVLSMNRLRSKGVAFVSRALECNHALEHLDLAGVSMGNEGAISLASSLRRNITLLHLGLGGNEIGASGEKSLLELFRWNSTLSWCEGLASLTIACHCAHNSPCIPTRP